MGKETIRQLIAAGETFTVEFKSDVEQLPDAELIEVVVCLTNAQGGTLLIGVEDDGQEGPLVYAERWRLPGNRQTGGLRPRARL